MTKFFLSNAIILTHIISVKLNIGKNITGLEIMTPMNQRTDV